ncbi:hypothetical protein GOP47_0025784 [Adiantum capillus-veneris]|uniref:Amino acid transporter transmembrane domain-containing protein n=1 Tax=Adiantum capillus-veneris TaxID=13818 RepID=A0A9D4U151_ADICA|nr:hypothetical protein GOP47_0025784 [Adiantum capillus-veneris]
MGSEAVDDSTPLLRRSTLGNASAKRTFGNIIVSIVGTGVLGLPYTFRVSGWASGTLAVVVSAILSYYCMILLVNSRNKLEEKGHADILTYGELGNEAYGSLGHTLVDIMVLVSQCGFYWGVCGRSQGLHPSAYWQTFAMYWQWEWCSRMMSAASVGSMVWWHFEIGQAFILITILYVTFGLVSYFAFGDNTKDIITLNLPNDWSTIVVKVGLCIALTFTFPVMMYPVHELVENKLIASTYFQKEFAPRPMISKLLLDGVRGMTVLIVAAIAVMVPTFSMFISVVGSTVCAMMTFVFPAFFHLRVFKGSLPTWQWAVDVILIGAGLAFAVYGTYTTCLDGLS